MSHLSAPLLISPHTDFPHDVKSLILILQALNSHSANLLISADFLPAKQLPGQLQSSRIDTSRAFRGNCPAPGLQQET